MRTMSRATINYDMSADKTRDTRSESRLWVIGRQHLEEELLYVIGTQKKSYILDETVTAEMLRNATRD